MLVELASPLRRLHVGLDRKQTLFLDGVRHAAEISHFAYGRLLGTLREMPSVPGGTERHAQAFTAALLDAWVIVDSVHRLRELLEKFPQMKQRVPELQVFYRLTRRAKDLRNVVQHLPGEISGLAEAGLPLWGSITWRSRSNPEVEKEKTFGLCAGTFYQGARVFIGDFDHQVDEDIGRVCLTVGPHSVDLGELVAAITPVIRFLERLVAEQSPDGNCNGSDLFVELGREMIHGESPPSKAGA